MTRATRLLLLLAAVAPVQVASAQAWRTIESTRQLHDTAQHKVFVRYGAGRLDIGATNAPVLYSMTLRYDEAKTSPLHRYDADARTLTLGVEGEASHFSRDMGDKSKGEMRLSLSRTVPIDLDMELGATKASLDLGGLSLLGLHLESGASETLLDFSTPNQTRMRKLDVDVGAASFEARNLANSNASDVHVQGGVGAVELDFGGQWSQDMNVDAELALGKLTLRVPRDIGVRIEAQMFLASFDHQGLQKRGDAYYSENWDKAKYHLRLRAGTTFGGIELDRADY
ncbi:MAG TPA: LiaF domain-containing protein [Gemmatimonadaceae bacterium]